MKNDYSESIKLINEANSDATELVKKWKQLITSSNQVTIEFSDGTQISTNSVMTAIRKFLTGEFESIILSNSYGLIRLAMDLDGSLRVEDGSHDLMPIKISKLSAQYVNALSVEIATIDNSTIVDSTLNTVTATNSTIENCRINRSEISNATFTGNIVLPDNTVVKGLTASSVVIGSKYVYPNKSTTVTQDTTVTIPVYLQNNETYGQVKRWANSGSSPRLLGFQDFINTVTGFSDVVEFKGQNDQYPQDIFVGYQGYNLATTYKIKLDQSLRYFESTFMNTTYNPDQFRGIGAVLLHPYKVFTLEPFSGNYYNLQLMNLKNFNNRIFIAKTGRAAQYVYTRYEVDKTLNPIIAVPTAGVTLPAYSAQKFLVQVTDENNIETTTFLPM